MTSTILVTGAAGFIGAALTIRLLQRGDRVVGIDNLNHYYDPTLKQARLVQIEAAAPQESGALAYCFGRLDALMALFVKKETICCGQFGGAGRVRYSLENPSAYIQSNLVGFEVRRVPPLWH